MALYRAVIHAVKNAHHPYLSATMFALSILFAYFYVLSQQNNQRDQAGYADVVKHIQDGTIHNASSFEHHCGLPNRTHWIGPDLSLSYVEEGVMVTLIRSDTKLIREPNFSISFWVIGDGPFPMDAKTAVAALHCKPN